MEKSLNYDWFGHHSTIRSVIDGEYGWGGGGAFSFNNFYKKFII